MTLMEQLKTALEEKLEKLDIVEGMSLDADLFTLSVGEKKVGVTLPMALDRIVNRGARLQLGKSAEGTLTCEIIPEKGAPLPGKPEFKDAMSLIPTRLLGTELATIDVVSLKNIPRVRRTKATKVMVTRRLTLLLSFSHILVD